MGVRSTAVGVHNQLSQEPSTLNSSHSPRKHFVTNPCHSGGALFAPPRSMQRTRRSLAPAGHNGTPANSFRARRATCLLAQRASAGELLRHATEPAGRLCSPRRCEAPLTSRRSRADASCRRGTVANRAKSPMPPVAVSGGGGMAFPAELELLDFQRARGTYRHNETEVARGNKSTTATPFCTSGRGACPHRAVGRSTPDDFNAQCTS